MMNGSGQWTGELYEVPATWRNAGEEFPTTASLEAFFAEESNFVRTSTNPLKVPLVDDFPPGVSVSAANETIQLTSAFDDEFVDWDFTGGWAIKNTSGTSTGSRLRRLAQSLFDNGNVTLSGVGVCQFNYGIVDVIENNDFISDGDGLGDKAGKPLAMSYVNRTSNGQAIVQRNRFENWPSDAVDGTFRIIERNYFRCTFMLHFEARPITPATT